MNPPVAQKIPVKLITAGHERIDNYYWLNRRDSAEVMDYLKKENAYTSAMMRDTKTFQKQLFHEITSRIRHDDQSVPYLENGYYYYIRYEEDSEYPVYCRRKGTMDATEEIMLDGNKMAGENAFFEIGGCEVSPDNRMLAYCVDTVGRYLYVIMFRDLETGEDMDAVISGTSGCMAWADDNKTLFYTLKNPETLRSEKLMAHTIGTRQPDRLVYHETDDTFDIDICRSKSEEMIFMMIGSNHSTEYRYLHANNPTGAFCMVQPREKDHEYEVTHYHDKFYIVTNDAAKNFRLMETFVDQPSKENWKELIPHRDDILLEDIELFDNFMVISEHKDGLIHLRVISTHDDKKEHEIDFGEEVYAAEISYNPSFDTNLLRFSYSSLTTPPSTYDYNMLTREKILLKQQEVVGSYNPDNYIAKRLYVPAQDGKEIPVSLVHRKDIPLNGDTPLLLYGYGAYGINVDPVFSIARISLLDRGFIFAVAHIRGGQTLGREWYEDGRLLHKRNSFTDFITCAEYLITHQYTDAAHLCATGGSAGGLLMGAVVNMRPDLFRGVIAAVPFVDVITTMSDQSIPLTTGEYDEWGDPGDETYYQYMMSYSPYDNITAQAYPDILVTAGLHDSQVQYWEPAKWVAKLRATKTDNRLLLLYTNMDAGHGGASGRFAQYRETALEYAFLCKVLNRLPIEGNM